MVVAVAVPVGELSEGGAGHGQKFSFFEGLQEILGLVDKPVILFSKIMKFILNAVLLIFFLEVGDHSQYNYHYQPQTQPHSKNEPQNKYYHRDINSNMMKG